MKMVYEDTPAMRACDWSRVDDEGCMGVRVTCVCVRAFGRLCLGTFVCLCLWH